MKKILTSGQAAILTIFVTGMVGLLIGMSLTKTGYNENIFGIGNANSTYAFYAANSGIEEALYRIKNDKTFGNPGPDNLNLDIGDAKVAVTVSGTKDERKIESIGKYKNFKRVIDVSAYNTEITPGFARAIQAGLGGIEFENRTLVTGRDKYTGERVPVSIFSNSYVRGADNGRDSQSDCSKPASTTRIDGNVYAVGSIERLGGGSGPCIDGDAFSGSLKECRVFGKAFSNSPISESYCPYATLCDPAIDSDCKTPETEPLPNIEPDLIKTQLDITGTTYNGNCVIGGANDCSTLRADGVREIGNITINGDLSTTTNLDSYYLTGPVYVTGNLNITSNQTISLAPEASEASLLILVKNRINTESNVTFTSTGNSFLLLASEYNNQKPDVCNDGDEPAIKIGSNVNSILFYAINGCVSVENPTASAEFYGAIVGEGIKFKNNATLVYDPSLKDAIFFLKKHGGWQISSFTER